METQQQEMYKCRERSTRKFEWLGTFPNGFPFISLDETNERNSRSSIFVQHSGRNVKQNRLLRQTVQHKNAMMMMSRYATSVDGDNLYFPRTSRCYITTFPGEINKSEAVISKWQSLISCANMCASLLCVCFESCRNLERSSTLIVGRSQRRPVCTVRRFACHRKVNCKCTSVKCGNSENDKKCAPSLVIHFAHVLGNLWIPRR